MEIKTTSGATRKMRVKDMEGLRVKTVRCLQNSYAIVPAGTEATVTWAAPRWGLALDFDCCPHCKLAVHMTKVPPRDVMIVVDNACT